MTNYNCEAGPTSREDIDRREPVMRDKATGRPIKWVVVKVRKTIEEDVPITVFEDEGEKEAIELMKTKSNPFSDPRIRWDYNYE